ncbi:hypothetical protein BT69DRAFT_1279390 [Atractiella rhizophila]|nr:hypothetical protein BT69DRAFT_1279390 [Atractiella rhizophila]
MCTRTSAYGLDSVGDGMDLPFALWLFTRENLVLLVSFELDVEMGSVPILPEQTSHKHVVRPT